MDVARQHLACNHACKLQGGQPPLNRCCMHALICMGGTSDLSGHTSAATLKLRTLNWAHGRALRVPDPGKSTLLLQHAVPTPSHC